MIVIKYKDRVDRVPISDYDTAFMYICNMLVSDIETQIMYNWQYVKEINKEDWKNILIVNYIDNTIIFKYGDRHIHYKDIDIYL